MSESKQTTLIGDAGGTSTSWRLLDGSEISQFTTNGFNYTTHSLDKFLDEITSLKLTPQKVILYTAGADTLSQKEHIKNELEKFFNQVIVENDLVGAARATLGANQGYVCILGTGSNASFYDGKNIQKVSASLGYLLGDEGSGVYLGKKLLKAVFRDQLDSKLTQAFKQYHQLSIADTIKQINTVEKPNLYLASFARFIGEHQNHPQIYQLIYDSFNDFFKEFFGNQTIEHPIHFIGSIAFHFGDILREVAMGSGFSIQSILESPIAGLTLYHQEYE